jgi:hypothetical protein
MSTFIQTYDAAIYPALKSTFNPAYITAFYTAIKWTNSSTNFQAIQSIRTTFIAAQFAAE